MIRGNEKNKNKSKKSKKSKNKAAILLMILLFTGTNNPSTAHAGGVNSELKNMFDSMGDSVNVTKAGSYSDQTGGYYTGGSVFVRNKVKNTELMNITPPKISAGCGGIDIFTGGLSFLNKDSLVNTLKAIGSNAKSYAFSLALQTITPQINNTLNELNALAQDANNMSINSCEAAATMIGSVLPKSETSSRYLCAAMGTNDNRFSDWVEARQECGKMDKPNANMSNKGEFKDILGDEFNLAWIALRKNSFLKENNSLAELFMSISGSIISKEDGKGKYKKTHLSSLAKNDNFIAALIEGGADINLYHCDDSEKCLNPSKKKEKIDIKNALRPSVETLLLSMAVKVRTDAAITAQEMNLVRSTTIPIFKVLAMQSAFREGASPIDISNFSEAISYELLLKYLESILDIANESLREYGKVQIDDSSIESLKNEISQTRRLLLAKRNGIYQQMHYTLSVINNSKQIEQQLHNLFTQTNSKGN